MKITLTPEQAREIHLAIARNDYNRKDDPIEIELTGLQEWQIFYKKEDEYRTEDILSYAENNNCEVTEDEAKYIAEERFEDMLSDPYWDCYWESIAGMIRELKGV